MVGFLTQASFHYSPPPNLNIHFQAHFLTSNHYFKSLYLIFSLILISFPSHSFANNKTNQNQFLCTGFLLDAFPDIERADLEVALKYWAEELGRQVNIAATVKIYHDLKQMQLDFEHDKINFIILPPLAIVNYFDPNQLADGYKAYTAGKATEDLLVVTLKQSKINSFGDVKNKHLSLLLNDKVSEMYANILALERFNQKAHNVFHLINYTYKSPQLIYKLFFKQTDVIFIYQNAYDLAIELNPQIKSKTQIIDKLVGIQRGIGFFHKSVDKQFRNKVITEMEQIHNYPQGQQLLNIFFSEKAVRSKVSDLKVTQQLKQRYTQLLKRQAKQK